MIAYSTNRPIGLGTWPSQHRDKVVRIVHFDTLTYVPEIRHNSFGYIEFSEDIPKADLDAYELVIPDGQDEVLESIVRALWRKVDSDRFETYWERALRKGYTEDELSRAFDAGYEKYGV
jgi:hypothetical protein